MPAPSSTIFIVPSWYPSPLHPEDGSFFREQARLIAAAGYRVVVIAVNVRSLKDFPRRHQLEDSPVRDRQAGVTEYRLESLNPAPWQPRRFFRYYRRQLRTLFQSVLEQEGRPDWVWIHSSLWAGAALAEICHHQRIPFLIEEHLKEFFFPERLTAFQRELIRTAYGRARLVAAPSRAVLASILRAFPVPENRGWVLPNPVDSRRFPLRSRSPNTRPAHWISVGLLRPEKGFDRVIEALADLDRLDRPGERTLTIVGSGQGKPALQKQIAALGLTDRVHLTGYLTGPELVRQLHLATAGIWGSDMETFGLAMAEALATGLPIVVPPCGGPEDFLLPDSGVVSASGSPTDLARSMRDVEHRVPEFEPMRIRSSLLAYCGEQAFGEQVHRLDGLLRS
ncbi:MAG: glycosyltransferase [Candidatus Neomarinimicrobiota bacterium]|nr:MAG: glycosyltransferase [Candidatus Neomarinimicrobiota bacterium]